MTTFLLNFLYAVAIDRQTQEPRRVVFFLLYYVIGFFVALGWSTAHDSEMIRDVPPSTRRR